MPDPTKQTLSATQTPALFGASPYLTRWMLLRHFIHGDPIDSPEHNRMDWGKRMQPLLLAQAAEDLHVEVHPNAGDTYVRRGLLGCTRDADIYCPDRGHGVLETKVAFDYGVWMRDWDGGKAPPKHVEIQTQQQMMVGDGSQSFAWGVIAVWVGGEMKYFERKPIDDLWVEITAAAVIFFNDVSARREGEPFGDVIEAPLLKQLFRPVEGRVLDLFTHPDVEQLTNQVRLMKFHAEIASANEKEKKRIEAKLRAVAGNAETVRLCNGVSYRLQQQSRKAYSVEATTFTVLKPHVPENLPPPIEPVKEPANILAGG